MKELIVFVKQMGIMKPGREYRDDDIEQIMQVLVYDKKLEHVSGLGL